MATTGKSENLKYIVVVTENNQRLGGLVRFSESVKAMNKFLSRVMLGLNLRCR